MSRRNEKLYHIYYGIKQRCYNPKNTKYDIYGGKGINICEEWDDDYEAFKEWSLEHGYIDGQKLSIDRIDSDGDYCPDNCQWISLSENSAKANVGRHKNKSQNGRMFAITPHGDVIEILNVCEFSRTYGLNRSSVSHRLNGIIHSPLNGWEFFREQQQKV